MDDFVLFWSSTLIQQIFIQWELFYMLFLVNENVYQLLESGHKHKLWKRNEPNIDKNCSKINLKLLKILLVIKNRWHIVSGVIRPNSIFGENYFST